MSNLGMSILYHTMNSLDFVWCERVFAPWGDMYGEMKKAGIPLYALESGDPLSRFDSLAFSVGYEMAYTTVLDMIDMAGLPLRSEDRKELLPIVWAGGTSAVNAEPMAPFIDLFVIDRFLIRKTRLAKVHMHVAKTGQKDILTCVQADKGRIVIPDKRRAHLVVDSSDLVEHGHSQILQNKKTLPVRQGMEEERLFLIRFALPISLGRLKVVLIITGYLFVCQSAKCTEIRYFPAMDICFSGTCSKRVCKVGKTGRQVKTAPLRADCGKRGRALSFQDSCGEAAA